MLTPISIPQALATGRLPTFELQYVDTELPADPDETLADDGTPQPSCECIHFFPLPSLLMFFVSLSNLTVRSTWNPTAITTAT